MDLGFLKDIMGIAGSGAQIWNLMRDQDNPAMDALLEEQREKQRLRGIALNPNSPEFRNYVAVREEADRANFAQGITDAMKARKRAAARGGVSTRPERFDETISAMRSRLTSGPRARIETQNALLGAAGTPNFDTAARVGETRNMFNRGATDATIRAGMGGVENLYKLWNRYNQQPPAELAGITPGRKPIYDYDDRAGYDVWEDKA